MSTWLKAASFIYSEISLSTLVEGKGRFDCETDFTFCEVYPVLSLSVHSLLKGVFLVAAVHVFT